MSLKEQFGKDVLLTGWGHSPSSGEASRLRLLAREKIMVLVGDAADEGGLAERLSPWEPEVAVFRVSDLGADVADRIGLRGDEVWVVRPDAHLAATLSAPSAESVNAAIARVFAHGRSTQGNKTLLPCGTVPHDFGSRPRCAAEETAQRGESDIQRQ